MAERSQFGLWRIGVVGSSHALSPDAIKMCEALGERLARHRTVRIVHGGLKRRSRPPKAGRAADWFFIEGAKRYLKSDRHERVETMLAEPHSGAGAASTDQRDSTDDPNAEMFIEGALRRIDGRTRESRRFTFVNSLDALVAVGGGGGTRQQLTLATSIEKPVLPVPCIAGAAQEFWLSHRPLCVSQLDISQRQAKAWETRPHRLADFRSRAREMVSTLLKTLPKSVFVIMPYAVEHDTLFDLVIKPAADSRRDAIWRLDRMQTPGAVTTQIEEGIRSCDYCIVVLDELRPNVMFEMGYAQALKKPLILLLRKAEIDKREVPFDISTLHRIEYVRPDADTLDRLKKAVDRVVRRSAV